MIAQAVQERLSSLEILAQRGIFPAKEQPHRPKDAFIFLCPLPVPGHVDTDPSFSIHLDGNRWKCWACGQSGGPGKLLELLDGLPITSLPKDPTQQKSKKAKTKGAPLTGCTLAQLAGAKNLPIDHLRSLGWRDSTYAGRPAIAIPWPGGIHYRVNLDGKPKYLWETGAKVSIYGIDRLEEIRRIGWALFVEGETDVAAGRLMGLPVVGIPGVSTWKQEWAFQFQGCQIYAWKEPDKGGESFVNALGEAFWDIKIIDSPEGIKDLCELYDQAGEGASEFFAELKAEARRWQAVEIPRNVPSTGICKKNIYPQ